MVAVSAAQNSTRLYAKAARAQLDRKVNSAVDKQAFNVLLARIMDGYHGDPEPGEVSVAEAILAARAPASTVKARMFYARSRMAQLLEQAGINSTRI